MAVYSLAMRGSDMIWAFVRRARVAKSPIGIQPTIFDNVSNDMRIAREEIFGPVLSVISVKDAEEAVKVADDTDFGVMPRKSFHDAKHFFPQSILSEMFLETLKSSVDDAVLSYPLLRPM